MLVVAYTLDALVDDGEKSAWYLQLRLSDGKAIARSYGANGQPEAGQSRTEQEFRRSFTSKVTTKAKDAWNTGMDAIR